ncbi:hypothetical protein AgCh_004572 [Apium graveolens]
MGEFMDFDGNYRRSFMRLRVGLDISGPLLREELENGHNPILQYNDSLKTIGLSHVAVNNVNIGQKFNKKQFQYDADATAQVYPKALLMDSEAKRMKVGNTDAIGEKEVAFSKIKFHNDGDKGGIVENIKNQKDVAEGASNNRPNIKKSYKRDERKFTLSTTRATRRKTGPNRNGKNAKWK